jgi:cation diffusion facilitator CzcD-associated flavoprotein CzcO
MNGSIHGPNDYDVIIVGAGISGINAAYRVQTQAPKGTTYTILESRDSLGGTWDLFKYPGIRSDSDLYTFGFPWRPWTAGHAIAEAPVIMQYLKDSVKEVGIDKNIQTGRKVTGADWSTEDLVWNLEVQVGGEKIVPYKARFIILGTGYYDYDEPMYARIPGLHNFKGTLIHPQFWPEKLDYTNKKVAIIGSGATAVTILPAMAKKAKMVTMVQRSPSYVFSLPNKDDPISILMRWTLPAKWAHAIIRFRWMMAAYAFFYFCRTFPSISRKLIRLLTKLQLPKHIKHDPHFSPEYNPWEQRLCMAPDGDFYGAFRANKADIVTGKIDTVTDDGIMMQDGTKVEADILITATGLKIKLAGGIKPTIDGEELHIPSKFMWKGVMLQDLPNAAFVIGYTNASWTLGADATAQMCTRIMNMMQKKGAKAVVPRLSNPEDMMPAPMLNINSTYIQKALNIMPKTGSEGNWKPRTNYISDIREAKYGDIQSGLEFLTNKSSNGWTHV